MVYIWNPWHGCCKKSEGCENCYVYFLDKLRGNNANNVYRVKNNFNYPIRCNRSGQYIIPSGSTVHTCLTSDFFLAEADQWRVLAWEMIRIRSDLMFFIITKRPERVEKLLPRDWGSGWNNVFLNVTTESQYRVDERVPILLQLPFKYKGISLTPFLAPISLRKYLDKTQIENVTAGGENYANARLLHYQWVASVYKECVKAGVNFNFFDIGSHFEKDGKIYKITNKSQRLSVANSLGLKYYGRDLRFKYNLPQQLELSL